MFKWLLVFVLCSVVFSAVRPWLAKLGVGNMPGDFRFRVGEKTILIPLGSTLFFSLIFWGLGKLF
jgi:hypothetical protein